MHTIKHFFAVATLMFASCLAAWASDDYKNDTDYLALRDSVTNSFNTGDSISFFKHIVSLEDYLLGKADLHAYYTQRCNEIVFLLNKQNVIEAYKLAIRLSKELRKKKLDKEMYMAVNMMGHIYHYCGNRDMAKQCFWEVIHRMEQAGYQESLPPIYMNLVGVEMELGNADQALVLLGKAAKIAAEVSPNRLFDIETRRTLGYFRQGDANNFLIGYRHYRDGVESKGYTSVHGRQLEIYYQAQMGHTDSAVAMALRDLGQTDRYSVAADIYARDNRWHEAYDALKKSVETSDSVNSIILSSSMQGIENELDLYDAERETARMRIITLSAISGLLILLVVALIYIMLSRRRHMKELRQAYECVLESDNMKSAFIRNVSHEVRTPLNIIGGFAQVLSKEDNTMTTEERKNIASAMQRNTNLITTLIDELLELSFSEATTSVRQTDRVAPVKLMRMAIREFGSAASEATTLKLDTKVPDDYTMLTNEQMMRRIIYTLTDNAVKNTSQGSVTLRLAVEGSQLTLVVEDTGCGIPAGEEERIFDRFVKLDEFKEGLGLGLTLCRSMVSRLGGTVVLDTSYAGPGARFVVNLPVNQRTGTTKAMRKRYSQDRRIPSLPNIQKNDNFTKNRT